MQPVFDALFQLAAAVGNLLAALLGLFPTIAGPVLWIAFFLFVVRWPDLRAQLRQGGWAAAALLYALSVVVWGLCSKPAFGEVFRGVDPPWNNILEKALLGGFWVAVAFVCGALQDYLGAAPSEVEIPGPPDGVPREPGSGATSSHGHGHAAAHAHDH